MILRKKYGEFQHTRLSVNMVEAVWLPVESELWYLLMSMSIKLWT